MFQKPFRVKSNSSIKGSERKKIRAHLEKYYANLSADQLQDLIPNKSEITQMKIFTHGGHNVNVYISESNPIFFEFENQVFPTVYTLWKYPHLLTTFVTWPPVFEKLLGGADLMQPGVVLKGDVSELENVSVNDLISVRVVGNLSPVAVGLSTINSEKLFSDDRKGKAVKIFHTFGDQLWSAGTKYTPPIVSEDINETDYESCTENREYSETETAMDINVEQDKVDVSKTEEMLSTLELVPETSKSDTELMDELLLNCFLFSLKTKMKKIELPLLTSTFYSAFILACCPSNTTLDVKKTSHKKFSLFLKAMQNEGVIEVKELSKGIESIVAVNCNHPLISSCRFKPEENTEVTNSTANQSPSYSPPEIEELYVVSAAVMPFFKVEKIGKGSTFSASEVRKLLTDYIKKEDLQCPNNPRRVILDPILADTLLNKGEYLEQLTWEEINSRCLSKMQPAFKISFPNFPPVIKKGQIQPIEVTVSQRTGNKKVTLVYNLETYGIDPEIFAHEVQVGVAASTSVGAAQARKGSQVLIQGNQTSYISKLLLEKYCLPRKFITGIDKLPTKKKK